jgi:hypothetical protein
VGAAVPRGPGLTAAPRSWRLTFYGEGWGKGRPLPLDRRFPVEARSLPTNPAPADQPYPLFALVGALGQLAGQGVSSRGDLAAVPHLRQRAHIRLNLNQAGEAA